MLGTRWLVQQHPPFRSFTSLTWMFDVGSSLSLLNCFFRMSSARTWKACSMFTLVLALVSNIRMLCSLAICNRKTKMSHVDFIELYVKKEIRQHVCHGKTFGNNACVLYLFSAVLGHNSPVIHVTFVTKNHLFHIFVGMLNSKFHVIH